MPLMARKSQVAMEYMMVVGFTLLLIVPIIAIYGSHRQSMNNQVATKQAENIARKIADSSQGVFYLGKPAKTTLKIYMPSNILNVTISNREIVFTVDIGKGSTEVVGTSDVNISGSISTSPGIQYIEIVADDYVVNVTTI